MREDPAQLQRWRAENRVVPAGSVRHGVVALGTIPTSIRDDPARDIGDREDRLPIDPSHSSAPVHRLPGHLPLHEVRSVADRPNKAYDLPATIALGVSTIHRYLEGHIAVTITAFVPIATEAFRGEILDLNAKRYGEPIPDRSILSDFGRRPCIGIDKRPGTPLDRWLAKIVACLPHGPNGYELEHVLEYLRTELGRILRPRPEPPTEADRIAFPWDQNLELPREAEDAFARGQQLSVGDPPIATGTVVPVIPLELFLDKKRGACIQKAMVAAVVLERLGFGARLVNGAVDLGLAMSSGHAWVELDDGRILCPTWGLLERPVRPGHLPGEMQIGASLLFESQRSPYLARL